GVHHRRHRAHRQRHRRTALEAGVREPRLRREPPRRVRAPTQTIAYAAYKSVRDDEPAFTVDLIYYQMYQLAIGIHMAGPNLTPQTFEAGMFAYPARSGPFGLWKYGPGDRTAANDVREIYWDPNAISAYNGQRGAYIGANDGARYQKGQIPAGPPSRPTQVGLG